MYAVSEEGGAYLVEFSIVSLKDGDVSEERVAVRVDRSGRLVEPSRFQSLDQAISAAALALLEAADAVEAELDRIEYGLESDGKVDPLSVYNVAYLIHTLYGHSRSLRSLAARLRRMGLVRQRTYETARAASRRIDALRRNLFDLRLLHLAQIQNSINVSMKRMTLVSTVALPAILISSIYGMNLSHLPLADSPEAVFALIFAVTAAFAALVYRM
ncbi:MAG: CorA family divalent cation transporter [Thermoproteus sp.]